MKLAYKTYPLNIRPVTGAIHEPLPHDIAEEVLLTKSCHVDHEGFDLNEIEQEYHKVNEVALSNDPTWYKDGQGVSGANAIILPWIEQTEESDLIIDHSHFVFRHPIRGRAAAQVMKYAEQRPELYRLVSTEFKCGLDLCIDYLDKKRHTVQPIVHIEWDFACQTDMLKESERVEGILRDIKWKQMVPAILRYNELARENSVDAFSQADTRAQLLFGQNAYKLIPTL
jgi:hypothetical protein